MADVKELSKKLNAKAKFITFLAAETEEILAKNEEIDIVRQLGVYKQKQEEFHELKNKIIELKVEAEDSDLPEVEAWRKEVENSIKEVEPFVVKLKQALANLKQKQQQEQHEQELKLQKIKIEKELELKNELVQTLETKSTGKQILMKLPKLSISRFRGTHLDFFRFWNTFETEVDKATIDPITKFNYLKEFLESKVRPLIENLPHTAEGYERAKSILKSKFGKPSEVINAHVQTIMNLPHIKGANPHKIHEFYAKLLPSVQALESMNKLREISGYCRATLDKLEGIRANLTRLDDNWQEWGFPQLVTALGNWTERNPANQYQSRDKSFATNQNKVYSSKANNKSFHRRACIYCDSDEHKSIDCKTVTTLNDRRSILKEKRVCFNCKGFGHLAVDCRSKGCHYCNAKHHSSVCDKKSGGVLLATGEVGVVYPVVMVKVEGVTCRALLNTGSGSTYVSNRLVEEIGKKPIKCEQKQIDMMMSSAAKRVEVYSFEVSNTQKTFNLKVDVTKVEKRELLSLPNPKYKELINKFEHLRGVVIEDTDEKEELSVHMIIGTSEFSKIKTPTKPRVGKPGEPVAELTLFGWMMMSPGHELEYRKFLFARSSSGEDYERLCSLDVLGLESRSEQNPVHQEFKDQLERSPEGWYQTGLIWKAGIPDLPSNESGSKARLKKLVQRLEKQPELYDKHEEIIKEQEKEGIIERAPEKSTAKSSTYLTEQ